MFAPDFLAGKLILVTGASSGLGRDFAVAAANYGARILAFGRDEERLAQTLDECPGDGHSRFTDAIESVDEFVKKIRAATKEHGPVYGMFHCAGANTIQSMKGASDRTFDLLYNASVRGTSAIIGTALRKSVMEDGGRIVLMSSASAFKPAQGLALYGSAKAAIAQMANIAAPECAKRGITVNTIAAGNVVTEMHQKYVDGGVNNASERIEAQYPLGFGQPEDVSNLALYLMSPGGRWITGESILLDGGFRPA